MPYYSFVALLPVKRCAQTYRRSETAKYVLTYTYLGTELMYLETFFLGTGILCTGTSRGITFQVSRCYRSIHFSNSVKDSLMWKTESLFVL
jgi:hypothetical protein